MAIEELYAERLAEYYEMLAHHYERAEVWEKALHYLLKAGHKTQQAHASSAALAHFNRALSVCDRLGKAADQQTLMNIYAGQGLAHFLMSKPLASAQCYEQGLRLAQATGDADGKMESLYQTGNSFLWAHEFERAMEYAERLKTLALERDSSPMLAASKQLISLVYLVTGKLGEATLFAEESLRLSREAHIPLLEAFNLFWLGIAKSWRGEFNSALELSAEAKALAKAHNLQMVLLVEWTDCLSHGGQGRYDDALASLGLFKQ